MDFFGLIRAFKMEKTFFRVAHQNTQQGLWYDGDGEFTGLIHNRFAFCHNHELRMEFDPDIAGYMSAVENLELLFHWFSRADILQLQEHGFGIVQYIATDWKWYERFQHHLIARDSAHIVQRIALSHKS